VGWPDPRAAFTAVTQLGTETAVLIWGQTLLATAVAFAVGYAAVAWFLRFVSHHSFTPFVVYRVTLGAILVALVAAGLLAPGAGPAG
jgi:undecaprenyl-diphosphatase